MAAACPLEVESDPRVSGCRPKEDPDPLVVELASGAGSCGAGLPDLVMASWWVGPVPDTADYKAGHIPKLVLAWW